MEIKIAKISKGALIVPFCKSWKVPKEAGNFEADLGNIIYYGKKVFLAGLGDEKEVTAEKIRRSLSVAMAEVRKQKITEATIEYRKIKNLTEEEIVRAFVESLVLGNYSYDKYKSKKDPKTKKIFIKGTQKQDTINKYMKICENTNFVRNLVNEQSASKYPDALAKIAKETCRKAGIKCNVYNEKHLKKMGMNLMLAVGRGSKYPPRLVVMEYHGNKKTKEKIALVGKGITFDSGGINLKPTGYIETMKVDMAGSATVLATIKTAAELKLKKNLIGVMAICENMVGSNATRPSDIVTSHGISVEITNTDAEGRLALGDAVSYVEKKYKPRYIIDLATLTGSCMVTFGEYVAALMTNDKDLGKKLFNAGEVSGERVWELPIYDDYREELKGSITDIRNTGYRDGRYAGAITAAAFIEKFIKKTKWVHFDIAGTAWYEKPRWYIPYGGTGFGVRLLTEFLEK